MVSLNSTVVSKRSVHTTTQSLPLISVNQPKTYFPMLLVFFSLQAHTAGVFCTMQIEMTCFLNWSWINPNNKDKMLAAWANLG